MIGFEIPEGAEITRGIKFSHVLTQGGQGTVGLVYSEDRETYDVIKFSSEEVIEREAFALRKLRRNSTYVPIFQSQGTYNDMHYLVMSFGDGRVDSSEDLKSSVITLDKMIHHDIDNDNTPVIMKQRILAFRNKDPIEKIPYCSQLLNATKLIHAEKIIHRDLKPPNILFIYNSSGREFLQVLDFGLHQNIDDILNQDEDRLNHSSIDHFFLPTTSPYNFFLDDYVEMLQKNMTRKDFLNKFQDKPSLLYHEDIYSLGLTFIQMFVGYDPIQNIMMKNGYLNRTPNMLNTKDKLRLYKKVLSARDEFLENRMFSDFPGKFSNIIYDLMLSSEPKYAHINELVEKTTRYSKPFAKRHLAHVNHYKKTTSLIAAGVLLLSVYLYQNQFNQYEEAQRLDTLRQYEIEALFTNAQEILADSEDGQLDDLQSLSKFNQKYFNIFIRSPLEKAIEVNKQQVNPTHYQIPSEATLLETKMIDDAQIAALYYPKALLLAYEFTNEKQFLQEYVKFIGSLKYTVLNGYRHVKALKPLKNFLERYEKDPSQLDIFIKQYLHASHQDSTQVTVSDFLDSRKDVYNSYLNEILNSRIKNIENTEISYLIASTHRSIQEKRHLISADSAWLLEFLKKQHTDLYHQHLQVMKEFLIGKDFVVYDNAGFDSMKDTMPLIRISNPIDGSYYHKVLFDSTSVFPQTVGYDVTHSYSISMALVQKALRDSQKPNLISLADSLLNSYVNYSKTKKYPPEFIPAKAHHNSTKVISSTPNNFAAALILENLIAANTHPKIQQEMILAQLKYLVTNKEFPNSRLETYYQLRQFFPTHAIFANSLHNYIEGQMKK